MIVADHWSEIKPDDWPLTYFTPAEVSCKGTGAVKLDVGFGVVMDGLRRHMGGPVRVSSWYRSPGHNASVSSTGYDGPHTTGAAADVICHHAVALKVLRYAQDAGIVRIGVSQKGDWGSRFIHLDQAPGFSPALWSY